jgi:hypothetical protein
LLDDQKGMRANKSRDVVWDASRNFSERDGFCRDLK